VDFTAEFIGRGPLEEELRSRARSAGLANRVRFLGYIEDHSEVEAMLAASTIGVAPYDADPHSFTRFADPAKLKTYLAAGLPILMTDVPPNASELEAAGVAEIVPFKAETLADAIQRLLASPEEWNRRRIAALKLRGRYDWGGILTGALEALGYRS
jgi:glycosyltransferase involved in cell wall biosynthesis